MAILNLTGSAADVLKRIVAAENPKFNQIPDSFKFGNPIPGDGVRTTINMLGLPGKKSDVLASGIQTLQYNRIDLSKLFIGLKPLNVYGCVTTRDVLHVMQITLGVDIDPNFIVDEALVDGTDTVTLTYQNHTSVLLGESLIIPVTWSNTIDIALLFKEKALDGFTLPWPYLQDISVVFALSKLDGFTYPELTMDMAELSKHWTIDDADGIAWASTRTAGGAYAIQAVVNAFMHAAPFYPWKFIESEIATYNLWGSSIVSNEPSSEMPGYTHVLKLRVNTTYFHEGSGIVTFHYKQ